MPYSIALSKRLTFLDEVCLLRENELVLIVVI